MNEIHQRLASCTLDRYENEFADRQLVHGAIEKWARETPDAIALAVVDTEAEFTYQQFDQLATSYALQLLDLGYRPGDFLATHLPLLAEHIFLEYACFKIGVIHAPLDLRLKGPEVIRSLQLIEARGFVGLGGEQQAAFGDIAREVQQKCSFVKDLFQIAPAGETVEGALTFEEFLLDAQSLAAADHSDPRASALQDEYARVRQKVSPDDGAQVIYTTGSTGLPKPALLSHRNITSQNLCLATGFNLFATPRMLVNLPPSHVGCQAEELMTTLFIGGTAVVLHVFDAEKSLQAIQKYQINSFGQIPAMFHLQWQLPSYDDYDLSSVQVVLFGGQQVTTPFVERLLTMAPQAATGLGLTEMAGFVTYTGATTDVQDLVESVGWAAPITPLTIRRPMRDDGSAGEELPDGETGEICFTGPQVFVDYVNNREAYQKTVSTDGVCYTGDLGYKSRRGLIFCGRSKLVIKPKGYQVHPAQIEQHFAMLKSDVAICGAVGAPHETFIEAVVLFIEGKPDAKLSDQSLEAHARGIAAYMRPTHYVIMRPGEFPLNRVNKTDYVKLSELALEEVDRLRAAGGWDR